MIKIIKIVNKIASSKLSENLSILTISKVAGAEAPACQSWGRGETDSIHIINSYFIISIFFINKWYLFYEIIIVYLMITLVFSSTMSKSSITSLLAILMQPFDALVPKSHSSGVP